MDSDLPKLHSNHQLSMDLQTENHLATLLMEEARRLRLEADKEGVHVYLRKQNIRGRPNSRFLTATVLGVQQANRVVEVNEMWRARDKERELKAKRHRSYETEDSHKSKRRRSDPLEESPSLSRPPKHEKLKSKGVVSHSSRKEAHEDCNSSGGGIGGGMKEEEIEEFLQSRKKRGRGAVGSRMDEPGPYLSRSSHPDDPSLPDVRDVEEWERRICGPEKPSFLQDSTKIEGSRAAAARSSRRQHSHKHGEKKRSKHRHKSKKAAS